MTLALLLFLSSAAGQLDLPPLRDEQRYDRNRDRDSVQDNIYNRNNDRRYPPDDDRRYGQDDRRYPQDDGRRFPDDDRRFNGGRQPDDDRRFNGRFPQDDRRYPDDDRRFNGRYPDDDRRFPDDDRRFNGRLPDDDRRYPDDDRFSTPRPVGGGPLRGDGRFDPNGRRVPEVDYSNLLASLDFIGTQRCSANVAAQWNYETNVNEVTQLQAVSLT